jgi:hypothetical protein
MRFKLFGLFFGALAITVFFILPAEYGYDPSGIGEKVGLLRLSESSVKINEEDSVNIIRGEYPSIPEDYDSWYPDVLGEPYSKTQDKIFTSNTILVELESGEQVEYKALMQRGDMILYSWSVEKGIVYTDFHADPTENKDLYPDDYFIRYRESEISNSSGSMVASFTGNHGWYWLNIEEHPIRITLEVAGFYSEIKELGRSFQ